MNISPLVSIITPAYNAKRFLKDTYRAVDQQTFRDFEWLIIDDGSTDGTRELLSELESQNSYIKVVYQQMNLGPVVARNEGVRRASGRFLAFLDADDLWLPKKLQSQISFMREENVAFSFHDYRHMNIDGTMVGDVICGPSTVNFSRHHTHRDIGCLTVMIDREKCNFSGFENVDVNGEDFLAWGRILKTGVSAKRLPDDLARYRLVKNSRSANKLRKIFSVFKIYFMHEKIRLSKAFGWWLCFLVNAKLKHYFSRPRISRSLVDVNFGSEG